MTFQPAPIWDGDPPDHRRLLDMAHELGPIANKGNHVRLSDVASALLEAFVRHAEAERPMVLRLSPFTAREQPAIGDRRASSAPPTILWLHNTSNRPHKPNATTISQLTKY